MKYFEILKELKKLREEQGEGNFSITVLSNIIVSQLTEVLEYTLRIQGINAEVRTGNYDNIVQDADALPADEIVVIFWEVANLIDGLQYKIEHFSSNDYEAVLEKARHEISMVFESLSDNRLALFNTFHPFPFIGHPVGKGEFFRLTGELNNWLRENLPRNFRLVDSGIIISSIGFDRAFDIRNYFSSKALYTVDYFRVYAREILPFLAPAAGKVKKVLVLDCDNTLWKGVMGEDGIDGIKLSPRDKEGLPFHAVQHKIGKLAENGVILCLCSKNNPADVQEVFDRHPDMVIKDDQIVLKKINWNNKADNLKAIARELNVGYDSLVFIDDSDFEVNLIRAGLPEVSVFQVPGKLYQYPALMDEVAKLFYNPSPTDEDKSKTEQYKAQIKRAAVKDAFADLEAYIKSLEISLKIHVNESSLVKRMAQMTQKTNQFNLTTKRYTEQEILNMTESPEWDLYALEVSDKYGDSGVTGLAIIRHSDSISQIDTFLLSCRVIGRNIEYRFIDWIIGQIPAHEIHSAYFGTLKNGQVSDFYEKSGFELTGEESDKKYYRLLKSNYNTNEKYNYIRVFYERTS